MTTTVIGVRELQRDTSRLVREVEEHGTAFRVTLQGRQTPVMLKREEVEREGVSVAALLASGLYQRKPAEVAAAQLAEVESSRDRAGRIGE